MEPVTGRRSVLPCRTVTAGSQPAVKMSAAREIIGAIPFTLTANVESLPHLIHVAGPKEIAPALQSPFTGFHISLLKQRISDGPVRKILPHRVVFKKMFKPGEYKVVPEALIPFPV